MYYAKNKVKQAGFTLMEILIALFIFTVLSMILASALSGIIKVQAETEEKAERLHTLQMVFLGLSSDVEQTLERPILTVKGKNESAFIGAPQSFSLTHTGYSVQRCHYFVEGDGFWRETWDHLDLAPTAKSHKKKLLEVATANFEYLDEDGRFHDKWPFGRESQQALPRAIKITFNFPHWGKISQLYVIPAEAINAQPSK